MIQTSQSKHKFNRLEIFDRRADGLSNILRASTRKDQPNHSPICSLPSAHTRFPSLRGRHHHRPRYTSKMEEIIMILGNPGTGKSTLLNCLIGNAVFESGLTNGAGMGRVLQTYETDDGTVYMDTPGLADLSREQEAIEAIRAGLTRTGSYRLFFMVRLEGGRVSQEDVVTIDRVLSAINLEDIKFSVIVNKISTAHYRAMLTHPREYRTTFQLINSGRHTTESVHLLPMSEELEERQNAVMALPQPFLDFVEKAPRIVIKTPDIIGDIAIGHQVDSLRQVIGRRIQEIILQLPRLVLLGEPAISDMVPEWEPWMVTAIGSVALAAAAAAAVAAAIANR